MLRAKLILYIAIPILHLTSASAQVDRDVPFTPQQTDSLLNAAKLGAPDKQIELGRHILQKTPDSEFKYKALACEVVGMGYFKQNRFLSAIYEFENAADLFSAIPDSAEHSRLLNLIGVSYTRLRQYGKAIEALKQALAIREIIGDTIPIAATLNNLAACFRSTNQVEAAIETYSKSYSLYKQINDLAGQSFTLNNLGLISQMQGDYENALKKFSESLNLKISLSDSTNMATTYGNIGNTYSLLKKPTEAIGNYLLAAKLYEHKGNKFGLAETYNSIAELYLAEGDHSKAYHFIVSAKKLITFKESSTQFLRNLMLLSRYNYSTGNYKQSHDLLYDYIKRSESVFNDQISNRVAELSFMHDNERHEQEKRILEMNLSLERAELQRVKLLQYTITFAAVLLLLLLILSLFFTRKYLNKSRELARVNSELNHVNTHLETIVESRTLDLLTTLKKAQDSDKLKSTFLANMSHEVRTPLNGILGFASLLLDESLNVEERKQYIGMITRRGRNLLQIINDIINISLIDTGQVEIRANPFNLNQLMYDLYAMFTSDEFDRKRANVTLKLSLGLSDARSAMVTDPVRVEQILTNLLDNALRHTSDGFVEFGYEVLANNTIKFFVKDSGHGIPEEKRGNLFNRFNKSSEVTSTNTGGTGLGLPISKGLVELLKGSIWFETQVDKGTEFYFTLPYIPTNQSISAYVSRSSITSYNLDFRGKVILVVEDDLISYQFVEALLKSTEAKLIHAKNGEDAIEIAKLAPQIDLIIMDMRLPFIDGYDATKQIKAIRNVIPIVAQTANVMREDKERCLNAGCNDYLAKPIDPDEFLRVVAYYLNKPAIA